VPPHHSSPDLHGTVAIIVGTLMVSSLITLLFGHYAHWPPIILGIVVGLMAVKVIHG